VTSLDAQPFRMPIATRSRLWLATAVLALTLSACTTRSVMNFNRLDGRADAAAVAQFQQDDAICKGEVAKAQAMAAPIYMGHSLADAMEAGMKEGQRNNALRQIMVGCMAQRNYTMTLMNVPN
jgi:hypothetical protein